MIEGFYRYVKHENVSDYLNVGWMVIADLGHTHGRWSVLMKWPCVTCPPIDPGKRSNGEDIAHGS